MQNQIKEVSNNYLISFQNLQSEFKSLLKALNKDLSIFKNIMEKKFIIKEIETINSINGLKDVINLIRWQYIGISDNYAVGLDGFTYLDKPVKKNFIKFDNITKEIVIDWILQDVSINDLDINLDDQADKLLNPITKTHYNYFNDETRTSTIIN